MVFVLMGSKINMILRCKSVASRHFRAISMSTDTNDIKDMAALLVRDYLTGPWKKITPTNIVLQRVSGGLSNWLYRISLPSNLLLADGSEDSEVPVQVLLRLHGQVNVENAFDRLITESVIFTLLSERSLGPKLYGVFPGGRIEEYIPARPLKRKEMSESHISLMVADKMAQIHSMNVPISKEPNWIYDTLAKWLKKVKQDLEDFEALDCETNNYITQFKTYDLDNEVEWLRKFLAGLRSPVVFSHNDMQQGNILLHESTGNLVLIDYEYCSYNYRGFDLANHFLEYTMDYSVEEHPNFCVFKSSYPAVEHQLQFIRRYLSSLQVLRQDGNSSNSNKVNVGTELLQTDAEHTLCDLPNKKLNQGSAVRSQVTDVKMTEEEETILREIECFGLASHLTWGLWGAVQAQSQIPFGYWEYSLYRLEWYFEQKKKILSYEVPGKKRKL